MDVGRILFLITESADHFGGVNALSIFFLPLYYQFYSIPLMAVVFLLMTKKGRA